MAKRKKKKDKLVCQLYGAILIVASMIALLHEYTGLLGEILGNLTRYVFGEPYFIFYLLFIVLGFHLIFRQEMPSIAGEKVSGFLIVLAFVIVLCAIPDDKSTGKVALEGFFSHSKEIFSGDLPAKGGAVGSLLYSGLSFLISRIGTIIVSVIAIIVGVIIFIGTDNLKSFFGLVRKGVEKGNKKLEIHRQEAKRKKEEKQQQHIFDLENKKKETKPAVSIDLLEDEYTAPQPVVAKAETPKPTPAKEEKPAVQSAGTVGYKSFADYKLPRYSLLDNYSRLNSSENRKNAGNKGRQLIEILEEFDVPCELQNYSIGPSVTKYEVKPKTGIKVSKITSLQDNIKMELAVKDVRIEAPVPGKNAVGVEIPNAERASVRIKELVDDEKFKKLTNPLAVCLGKDLSGEAVFPELDRMPHLLIAGSTGSGKSVCINSIIVSLLLRSTPNDVKMLLIDPKKVEFTPYIDIPHLIGPVISDSGEASRALKTIVAIMDQRYDTFHNVGVRNIKEYNARAKTDSSLKHMYYIVVIIDELADLMLTNGKEVEQSIQRITQLARACGIHLIVATQRPSTDVITGTIKTNIPSRIAFAVASAIDSRIVLDQVGAERLLGLGDMLYIPMGSSNAQRIQGVYVSDDEINKLTQFVKSQGSPVYDERFIVDENGVISYSGDTDRDPLFDEVKKYIAKTKKASTSSIQRYFGIGYNRAARIIDMLEQEGSVGPVNGSKPREVFIKPEDL